MALQPMDRRSGPLHRTLDVELLAGKFHAAQPFPHVAIHDFLDGEFAEQVASAYPTMEQARQLGREFQAVNERGKVQVTAVAAFPPPLRALKDLLASPELRDSFSRITGIPALLADEELVGGGMHLMPPGAHLDVHVDFNRIKERGLYRRLNVLLFLSPVWEEPWGGELELWDEQVSRREQIFRPEFNLLVLFETSDHSFHGVRRIESPAGTARLSFAGYYYTREPPPGRRSEAHTTIFRSRPEERWKGRVLMPAERALERAHSMLRRVARLARPRR